MSDGDSVSSDQESAQAKKKYGSCGGGFNESRASICSGGRVDELPKIKRRKYRKCGVQERLSILNEFKASKTASINKFARQRGMHSGTLSYWLQNWD
jgi:hypothetical protein